MTPTQAKGDELDKAALEEIRPHARKVKTWMTFTAITSIVLLSIVALIVLIAGIVSLATGTAAGLILILYLIPLAFGFVMAVYVLQLGRGAAPFLETGDLATFDHYDAECRRFFKRWGVLFFIQLGASVIIAIIAIIAYSATLGSLIPSLY
ncbi:hypothetical protein JXM67_14065 [candidate division WOR-3 bacterium]|nr:hypothetical protein [candidate division WOR-3 bacterium]